MYKDGRDPAHKFTPLIQELRSIYVPVPDPKKLVTTILKPLFDGIYTNTHSTTVTVMIVADRVHVRSIYEKLSKCLFA